MFGLRGKGAAAEVLVKGLASFSPRHPAALSLPTWPKRGAGADSDLRTPLCRSLSLRLCLPSCHPALAWPLFCSLSLYHRLT